MDDTNTPPLPSWTQSHLRQLGSHLLVLSLGISVFPWQIYHRTMQMRVSTIWKLVVVVFQFQIGGTELGLGLLAVGVHTV